MLEQLKREQDARREERAARQAAIDDARQKEIAEKKRKKEEAILKASLQGSLYKRGGAAKTWKKRWFCIDAGVLHYYPSPKVPPLLSCDCASATASVSAFELSTSGNARGW